MASDDEEHDRQRDAGDHDLVDADEPLRHADRLVARDHLREAAIERQRADGDDDRGQLQADHHAAVERAHHQAGAEADDDGERDRHARGLRPGEDAGRERHVGGGREIDLAGDDHHRQHERDDREFGVEREAAEDVVDVEEERRQLAAREDAEDQQDEGHRLGADEQRLPARTRRRGVLRLVGVAGVSSALMPAPS